MIAYIVIVCNGDFDRMKERRSSLTWFEEWILYFEWKVDQTARRQIDIEHTWGIMHQQINDVKDHKLALEMSAMASWPRFASFDEDASLRKKDKWSRYDGYRPIIWDMTNATTHAFSDTSIQRVTYSEYYAENYFKAGIFCQL